MKKLLIILLLLSPVHGAWAEVINLVCSYTKQLNVETRKAPRISEFWASERSYNLDLKNKKTLRGWGINFISDQRITWRVPVSSPYPNIWTVHIISVDRYTGSIETYVSFPMERQMTKKYFDNIALQPEIEWIVTGSCKEGNKKKF